MDSASLSSLTTNNQYVPTQMNMQFCFPNVTSAATTYNSQAIWIPPDDYLLNEVAVAGGGNINGTVTCTIDNGAMIEPITITSYIGQNALTKLPRYYGTGSLATGKPVQVLLKDSVVTISLTTTDPAGNHNFTVTLCLDSRYRRY